MPAGSCRVSTGITAWNVRNAFGGALTIHLYDIYRPLVRKRSQEFELELIWRMKMNENELKSLYKNDDMVRPFLDHMAKRQRNQSESKVHRVVENLREENHEYSRGDIVSVFKKLESCGCGQFVNGRRGWPSRFVWSVPSKDASLLASGEEQTVSEIVVDETYEDTADETLNHTFNLRPDLRIEFDLPSDLTVNEANRLAMFIKSLPMEDFD